MLSGVEDEVGGDTDCDSGIERTSPGPVIAVIPAYNEQHTIGQIVRTARRYASRVIVVDDGSEDATSDKAIEAGANVIRIPKNSGKGHALSIGLSTAVLYGCSAVVCLDADGQHDPRDIPRIVKPVLENRADMVIGSRFLRQESKDLIPIYRKVGQRILTTATNVGSPVKITDSQSGYRAFTKELVRRFAYCETGMGIESEMIRSAVRSGVRIQEVPIAAKYDGLETSTLSPGNHGMIVLGSIIRSIRSEHPLLYFGTSGVALTIAAIAIWFHVIQQYAETEAFPFGLTLLGVLATVIGILFTLVGLILNAISELVGNEGVRTTEKRR